jgi:hypothetical protein
MIKAELIISSKVDLKEFTNNVGSLETNPTVSINKICWLFGSLTFLTLVPSVANNISFSITSFSFFSLEFFNIVLKVVDLPALV